MTALLDTIAAGADEAEVAAAQAQLRTLFEGRIAFGTAGLRSSIGAGPQQMNRLVVRQTTAGLMDWLPDGALVVIGYDARHGSLDFARDTAGVVAAAGGRAEILPEPLPTPVLAHAVLLREADAGVMVTASHNPPADNGYKLYLGDGIQLVSPADREIAAAIDQVAAAQLAGERTIDIADESHPSYTVLDDTIAASHIELVQQALTGTARSTNLVYTAMHGVGGAHMERAFERAGFPSLLTVAEQHEPNPDFPTVAFPNPEEDGALDLALARAEAAGADGIIANDPDADRLAIAVADRNGRQQPLSGDQLGVLLADHLIRTGAGAANVGGRVTANSVVSSRLLSRMAEAAGIAHVTTLTGFKFVARPTIEMPERHYLLGYEEALGYCVGGLVRDKDGISAALVAAEMLASLAEAGITVWDRLDALAAEHGAHITGPVTIRLDGPDGLELREAMMARVLADPPQDLAGALRTSLEDLQAGTHFPPATGAILFFDDDTRVIVRPSGTEPKLKAYIEVVEKVNGPAHAAEAYVRGNARLAKAQRSLQAYFGLDLEDD